MKELEIFRSVAADPAAYAARLKKDSGKRIIGYFCTYGPEELIEAAGCVPYRIFSTGESINRADAHLQAYSCSLVRGSLDDVLNGRLPFLDGTVFPHTCDSIQRLSDIWRLNAGMTFHFDVVLPVKLNTESAREYMNDVLAKFRRDLEQMTGKTITEERLRESVRLFNEIRTLLMEIYQIKSDFPGIISGSDINAVVRSSMVMDRGGLPVLLKELTAALKSHAATPSSGKKIRRVFLAGGMCNHPDIYTMIENCEASVIGDDLCSGSRHFTGMIDENAEPVSAIADRYFNRVTCPAKHASTVSRGEQLVGLVKEKRADGVILLFLKFCDPHAFDYPFLKQTLDNAGIKSLLLEIEEPLAAEGQIATRLETFITTL